MPDPRRLELHPDRLLPADPSARSVARRIYAATRRRPIVSPHGHVEAALLAEDRPFADPASLLVTPDHYVTRLLHASGAPLAALGVGAVALTEDDARLAWRILCERWSVFAGTPVRYWLEEELAGIFGVEWRPAPATADAIYDRVAARLADDDFRPRALYRRFGMEVLSTTPDPGSDLAAERALAADATWQGRVVPAFRPDVYLEPGRPPWKAAVAHLGEVTGIDTWDYRGYIDALEARRRYFADHGCVSTDHGHLDAGTQPLDAAEASRLFRAATSGGVSEAEAAAFRRHMVFEMARMSCEDGLVMALHVGVRRDHHGPTTTRFGRDTGSDIPLRIDFTDPLRPLLEAFGTHPRFRLVVFTVDETAWSRELAPLAGFYPSVYVGVPWWFLDAPDAIGRFRAAVTETAGFSRTSGFVDDARSLCSIPARHDMARRIDAGFLARLVVEHRMDEEEAVGVAVDLAGPQARRVFNL